MQLSIIDSMNDVAPEKRGVSRANVVGEIRNRLTEVNIVSFSGGKDSSVVLDLVFEAILGTGKKLLVITADTLMEIPYFEDYVLKYRIILNRSRSIRKWPWYLLVLVIPFGFPSLVRGILQHIWVFDGAQEN